MKRTGIILISLIIALITPTAAFADGIIIPDPTDEILPIEQLEIRYHHVDVTIENQVAVTHVDQVFYNPNDWTIEGTYIFPIPTGAAVTNFTLWIDGEPVEGEVLDAEQARITYEEIVRQMQDPALLEYVDRGAVRARVFPIPAYGERRIELEYTEVLHNEGGLVEYVYPLNTEKFSITPLESVSVSVSIDSNEPIRAVYSPSHAVSIVHQDNHLSTVGYEENNVLPDRDFALYYSTGETEAFHLINYRDPSDSSDPDGFFMLLLAPQPDMETQVVPKDVLLVLDRSGSMEGEKFQQAQQALEFILGHLNEGDRFNVISFSTGVEAYSRGLNPAAEADQAISWVNRQSAVGNTDINRALLEAASMADAERPTYLIFLTDGLPTEGLVDSDAIIDSFAGAVPNNLRLFAFGVGYDVDTYLLDSLAQENHGLSFYVLPGERIDEEISNFYAKISTPVLTDLELDFGNLIVYDLYPQPLPDLFAGSQIVVVGRYRDGGQTDIHLMGTVQDERQEFVFESQEFSRSTALDGVEANIPRLWATRKIGYLLNQIRLEGPEQELVDQVVRLSIRYGIVTPYTSYLVTEPVVLGESGQSQLADEAMEEMKLEAGAPSFGQEAVERAVGQGEMKEADVVSSPSDSSASQMKIVGSQAYILSASVWMDTRFDPEQMETVPVNFLSDDYFALIRSYPELGDAFALGGNVIAIYGGVAYEVVGADVEAGPLDLPIQETQIVSDPTPVTVDTDEPTPVIIGIPTVEDIAPAESPICPGVILPLLFLPVGWIVFRSRKQI